MMAIAVYIIFFFFCACSGFCMVANSLLAYASVNHLHYHFMCVAEPTLAARVVYIYATTNYIGDLD